MQRAMRELVEVVEDDATRVFVGTLEEHLAELLPHAHGGASSGATTPTESGRYSASA